MKQLRDASIEALQQVYDLVSILTPGEFCALTEFSSSSIGSHTRHVIDHYMALRLGIDHEKVNYNKRNRQGRIESDREIAMKTLLELIHWLRESELQDGSIDVESEISVSITCNKVMRSSMSRELCYLINHTVHHAAYMSVIAKQLGVDVSPTVGVAPATGSYLRAVKS